jgi:hypothetical protein
VTIPVTITNTGAAPEAYVVDARLNSATTIPLANVDPPSSSAGYALPLTGGGPEWLVPTKTTGVWVTAAATLPIMFDYGANQGDPDLVGAPGANNTAAGSYTPAGGLIQQGVWYAEPDEIGPFAAPAAAGLVNANMTVSTKPFDSAVTTAGGDLWTAALDPSVLSTFTPVVINPGQSAVINVTITPTGTKGTVVSGYLYIDDLVGAVPPYGETTGDELAAIPYTYTIK